MPDFTARRSAFRKLHESGCFVIPNPWDVGSAIYLQSLGFSALASSSAGFGFTQGLPDSSEALSRELVLRHLAELAAAVDLPINADYQSGYADSLEDLAESVRQCIATGVAGFSIEDSTGDPTKPLFELSEAVERIQAARAAIDASGQDVMLTARAECFLVGHSDPLNESIRRLQAYAEAGADVLFAPGPANADNIRAIVSSVSPKPVNVIVSADTPLTVADMAELGARRISVGSALARTAWTGFIRAAKEIADQGSFGGLAGLTSFAELNTLFLRDRP